MKEQIIIREEEAGMRLDRALAARYRDLYSRNYFQELIAGGLILLNGSPLKKRTLAKAGDRIELSFPVEEAPNLSPEEIPLAILYEDEEIVAIDKPAGLVVHPGAGNRSGTLVHGLLRHCALEGSGEGDLRPGIVHRLDKETSGILVVAKTKRAQETLIAQFAGRLVYKEYLAICLGSPGDRILLQPIGRHPLRRKEMAVIPSGKEAVTEFQTLLAGERLALVKALPKTGRTHQIRVHLKYLRAPLLGDALYGSASLNRAMGAERQMLHASRLVLSHPASGRRLELQAPLPKDFERWIGRVR